LPVDGGWLVVLVRFEVAEVEAIEVDGSGWPAGGIEYLGETGSKGGLAGARTPGYGNGVDPWKRHD